MKNEEPNSTNQSANNNPVLEAMYQTHHADKERYGFSYRVGERGPQFAHWIGTGKRILDIGCRDGELTSHYAANNNVVGLDIDHEALRQIKKRLGIEAQWHDINQAALPFDDESFDVLVAGEILEHLVSPEFVAREALRVLRQGGLFIGSVPNSFHWRGRLAFVRGFSIEDATHLQLFSHRRIQSLVAPFAEATVLPIGGIGGRRLPVLPTAVSHRLVTQFPALFANDFLFRAQK